MIEDQLILSTIEQCRLNTNLEEARDVANRSTRPLQAMDLATRNLALLLLERFVLNSQGGHRVTIKFGHSDAMNNPDCLVCRRPISHEDWSLRIVSRWEYTQLWVTWHTYCVTSEVELDFNILDGRSTSSLGYV